MTKPKLKPGLDEDWIKRKTWDCPTSLSGFMNMLGVWSGTDEEQKAAVAHFMTLPAAIPMPDRLKSELKQRGMLGEDKNDKNEA